MIMLSFVCCYGISFSAQGGQNGWSQALVWNLHPILQKELHFTLKIFEEKKLMLELLYLFFWNTADFIPLSCLKICFTSICVFVSLPALSCFSFF